MNASGNRTSRAPFPAASRARSIALNTEASRSRNTEASCTTATLKPGAAIALSPHVGEGVAGWLGDGLRSSCHPVPSHLGFPSPLASAGAQRVITPSPLDRTLGEPH